MWRLEQKRNRPLTPPHEKNRLGMRLSWLNPCKHGWREATKAGFGEVHVSGGEYWQKFQLESNIDKVRQKCFAGLASIRRVGHLPCHIRKLLYQSLVLPHLDYCAVAWRSCWVAMSYRIKSMLCVWFCANHLTPVVSSCDKLWAGQHWGEGARTLCYVKCTDVCRSVFPLIWHPSLWWILLLATLYHKEQINYIWASFTAISTKVRLSSKEHYNLIAYQHLYDHWLVEQHLRLLLVG